MSNGEETYAKIHEAVLKSLQNFAPEWDDLAQAAYDGFTADLEDDLTLDLELELGIDPEIVFTVDVTTDADSTTVKKSRPLSAMLADLHEWHGDDALEALERSVSRFSSRSSSSRVMPGALPVSRRWRRSIPSWRRARQ